MQAIMNAAAVTLVDGEFSDCLPVDDRGLMYGDGVFRTLRVADSVPSWWDEQLAKLSDDCVRIGLSVPGNALWKADLSRLSAELNQGVLKLMVTRGSGPRGYASASGQKVRRYMRYEASPRVSTSQPTSDIFLRVCHIRLGWQPKLAGIKHLNRLENVLARAEWSSAEFDEGLLLDQADQIISGVMSNIFLWRKNCLLTPKLDQCGVAGVARARLMRLAQEQGIGVIEANLTLQSVLEADEVMMTNSLWGMRRVARLESKNWPQPVISPRLSPLLHA